MRVDSIGPLGWLLGAIAGWALLVWALALFGLGGRIQPRPDDPSLLPALPALPAMAAARLGGIEQYAAISARPVFSENRQPQPFVLAGNETAAPVMVDVTLTSVLITPQMNMAILRTGDGQSLRLRQGDDTGVAGWRLLSVEPRSAVVEGPNGTQTLQLRVYDGSGGVPSSSAAPVLHGGPPPAPVTTTQVVAPVANAAAAPMPAEQPPPPSTSEQQMEEIRQRIQARRKQLQQQQQQQTPALPPGPKP